jgi:hypothetical protein
MHQPEGRLECSLPALFEMRAALRDPLSIALHFRLQWSCW